MATTTDAPDTIAAIAARPLDLLRAVENARRLALYHIKAPTPTPTGENWKTIAETQARLATQALEALVDLVEALGPHNR